MAKSKEKMRVPTQDELDNYTAKLESIRASKAMGLDTQEAEDSLREFMQETGIANEPPVTDFPELNEPDPEPDKL